ncbi:hypothetical protein DRR52_26200 [Escherichia coli]|nr:hypothetical protein [Escherichia coli]EEX2797554.1 hypothetical protein [Escherichia coli]EFE1249923.1 hypothetical protein [Escherichia coli]EFO2371254.1 hypothetical protein [Escherichia coli]
MVSLLFLWLKFILHGAIEGCSEGGGRPSHHLQMLEVLPISMAILFVYLHYFALNTEQHIHPQFA